MPLFAVIRRRGAPWDGSKPLVEQAGWQPHADFMNALHDEGFALLAGPLEAEDEALLILRAENEAEIEARLADDPWTESGMLETARISRWNLRLGSLG
jgi:uncharacterized protein YciI